MTTPITFFSHLATGLMAGADRLEVDDDLKASLRLSVVAKAGQPGPAETTHPLTQPVSLYRPCDVLGIDERAILRTDPDRRHFNAEFEPNYLASIEFAAPDLPWRFSLDPGAEGRRMPWVALVVLGAGEYELVQPSSAPSDLEDVEGRRLMPPVRLRVLAPDVLPPVEQTSAWVHVQADGDVTVPGDDSLRSGALRSRLLAARRLEPRTSYMGFLVPTYECGRLRGLNPGAAHEHTSTLSWENATEGHELPVYYSWPFATSESGDIEALIERLEPRGLAPLTGSAAMEVAEQEYGIPAESVPQRFEGAVVSTELPPRAPQPEATTTPLIAVLNTPAALRGDSAATVHEAGAVAPPIYGEWHSSRHTVSPPPLPASPDEVNDPGDWLSELNVQLSLRAAAGLGVEVVRRDQEELVAEAWRQIGDVLEARRRIHAAQLGYLTATRVFAKTFEKVASEALFLISRPIQTKIQLAEAQTMFASLAESSLTGVAESARLRSMLAPRGIAQKAVAFAPEAIIAESASLSAPASFEAEIFDQAFLKVIDDSAVSQVVGSESPTVDTLILDPAGLPLPAEPSVPFDGRSEAVLLVDPTTGAVDLAVVASLLLSELSPSATIPARINTLIDGVDLSSAQRLRQPTFPAPEIDTPMYEPLRDISASYLLPGIGDVPQNTVALLSSNQEFIEAYLAGANHEMAAELLWRGYPTDLRGTYFQKFWERGGAGSDISAIAGWEKHLGYNGRTSDPLVLLIRGDLIRRYPGIYIYARKAEYVDGAYRLGDDVRPPDFRGDLTADTVVVGFEDLRESDVRGDDPPPQAGVTFDPGFFFVLEERPRAVRFGLDEPEAGSGSASDWQEVDWSQVRPATDLSLGAWSGPIDLTAVDQSTLPGPPTAPEWNGAAADMAHLLFQRPYRIAIHARQMLPPDTQP